jgi:integrase
VLHAHLERQAEQRLALGSVWVESGYVFTPDDGSRLGPSRVSDEFERLAFEAGLPPITLHGLRHGAASITHTASLDMKIIQETLRHGNTANHQ